MSEVNMQSNYDRIIGHFQKHSGEWISRDAIAAELKVSRTLVYQHIQKAIKNGYIFQEGFVHTEGKDGRSKSFWRLAK
jgi:predicted ArsR family transcriptional regulator